MRYPASEKLEIIRLVEQSHLPVRRTLEKLGIPRATFYRWYDLYQTGGPEALDDRSPRPDRVWNRIPDDVRERIRTLALDEPALSPRELAVCFTDTESYFVSEASVYRLLKALDLIRTILVPGADGKSLPLGQVNGALGQTIGNLLNGKKTALGLLGAVATPLLTQASATTALGPVLALLTPAAGLAPFTLPIFLGLTAWGVLGKMEKWAQGTAPPPKIPS